MRFRRQRKRSVRRQTAAIPAKTRQKGKNALLNLTTGGFKHGQWLNCLLGRLLPAASTPASAPGRKSALKNIADNNTATGAGALLSNSGGSDNTANGCDLVVRDKDGELLSVRYDAVNAMVLNEFLKEHHIVQEQGATIARLEKQIESSYRGAPESERPARRSESVPWRDVSEQIRHRTNPRWWTCAANGQQSLKRWSWGCVSTVDSQGRTIWIADAHRDDGKRFVVRAEDLLTALILPFAYLGALR